MTREILVLPERKEKKELKAILVQLVCKVFKVFEENKVSKELQANEDRLEFKVCLEEKETWDQLAYQEHLDRSAPKECQA